MIDIPVVSTRELTLTDTRIESRTNLEELNKHVEAFAKIKGFGELVKEEVGRGEYTYFLTQAQALMLSSKFDHDKRWRLIESLLALTDTEDILKDITKAAIDRRHHKYTTHKSLIEVYRPLTNILSCCYDNEFYAATHYQFTHLINRMNITSGSITCYDLKEALHKMGFLDTDHRVLPNGMLRETAHHIEYHDGSHDTRYSPIYTEENISYLVSILRDQIV